MAAVAVETVGAGGRERDSSRSTQQSTEHDEVVEHSSRWLAKPSKNSGMGSGRESKRWGPGSKTKRKEMMPSCEDKESYHGPAQAIYHATASTATAAPVTMATVLSSVA